MFSKEADMRLDICKDKRILTKKENENKVF